MYSESGIVFAIQRFYVNADSVDDVCFSMYLLFKDSASSIASDRSSCSRMFIVGKDFEIRVYINLRYEGVLNIIMLLTDDVKHVANSLSSMMVAIDRALNKFCKLDSHISIAVKKVIRVKSGVGIKDVVEMLRELGVNILAKERKIVEEIYIDTIRGTTIGKNLKKYDIYVTILYNDFVELGIAIESTGILSEISTILSNAKNFIDYLEYSLSYTA